VAACSQALAALHMLADDVLHSKLDACVNAHCAGVCMHDWCWPAPRGSQRGQANSLGLLLMLTVSITGPLGNGCQKLHLSR